MPARELPDPALSELSALRQSRWPDCPPIGYELRFYPDCWVRFHSLPNSKRYAETEAEYQTVLYRHNTVLAEPGILDPLLRAVADDECNGVMIMDTDLRRVYHPYDGGADVIVADKEARDLLKVKHADWLPRNRHGR